MYNRGETLFDQGPNCNYVCLVGRIVTPPTKYSRKTTLTWSLYTARDARNQPRCWVGVVFCFWMHGTSQHAEWVWGLLLLDAWNQPRCWIGVVFYFWMHGTSQDAEWVWSSTSGCMEPAKMLSGCGLLLLGAWNQPRCWVGVVFYFWMHGTSQDAEWVWSSTSGCMEPAKMLSGCEVFCFC